MSEQPAPVLNAQVIVNLYSTYNDAEITIREEGMSYKDIAKGMYHLARHFEKLHRDELKENRQKNKEGKKDD